MDATLHTLSMVAIVPTVATVHTVPTVVSHARSSWLTTLFSQFLPFPIVQLIRMRIFFKLMLILPNPRKTNGSTGFLNMSVRLNIERSVSMNFLVLRVMLLYKLGYICYTESRLMLV